MLTTEVMLLHKRLEFFEKQKRDVNVAALIFTALAKVN
jgi:hypothetical protein